MSCIFLSHAHKNDRTANHVSAWLREHGHRSVFLDHALDGGIVGGEKWEPRLHSELQRCHALVALISAEWLASQCCVWEANAAHYLNKTIIPICIDGWTPHRLSEHLRERGAPRALIGVEAVDWTDKERVLKAIRKVHAKTNRSPLGKWMGWLGAAASLVAAIWATILTLQSRRNARVHQGDSVGLRGLR
jgi:TIR domain